MTPGDGEALCHPEVLARLASFLPLPEPRAPGAKREPLPEGRPVQAAAAEALAIVEALLAQREYPRIVERHGLRFVCYLADEWEWGSPPLVHVQAWDGEMWRDLAEVAGRLAP